MANILGQLLVELGINTAAFSDGLDKATYQAKQKTREMGDAIRSVGGSLSEAAGKFGAFGNAVGAVLSDVSSGLGNMLKDATRATHGVGLEAGLTGLQFATLGTAAIAAVGGVLELTHSMMALAEQIENTSAKTGLSIKDTQVWGRLAEETGVSAEALAMGIGRLQLQLGRFATSGASASGVGGAFIRVMKELDIAVTDAGGKVRPVNDILIDFARVLNNIQDPQERVELAMAAFGRSGQILIEVFNKARIEGKDFGELLKEIGGSTIIMADQQVDALAKAQAKWEEWTRSVSGAVSIAKGVIADAALHPVATAGTLLTGGPVVAALEGLRRITAPTPPPKPATGDQAADLAIQKAKSDAVLQENRALDEQGKIILAGSKAKYELAEAEKELRERTAGIGVAAGIGTGGANALLEKKALEEKVVKLKEVVKEEDAAATAAKVPVDSVTKYVQTLEAEVQVQTRAAAAAGVTGDALIKQKAEKEADLAVDKMRIDLKAKEASLEGTVANAKAAGIHGAGAEVTASRELAHVREQIAALDDQREHIAALTEEKLRQAGSAEFGNKLAEETAKIIAETVALAAYASALASARSEEEKRVAEVAVKMAPEKAKVEAMPETTQEEVVAKDKRRAQLDAESAADLGKVRTEESVAFIKRVTDETDKIIEETKAAQKLAAAKTPAERLEAEVAVKMAPDRAKLAGLPTAAPAPSGPALVPIPSPAAFSASALQEAKRNQLITDQSKDVIKVAENLETEVDGIQLETKAILQGAEARRQAKVQAEALRFETEHPALVVARGNLGAPGQTKEQADANQAAATALNNYEKGLQDKSDAEREAQLVTRAAGLSATITYQNERKELAQTVVAYQDLVQAARQQVEITAGAGQEKQHAEAVNALADAENNLREITLAAEAAKQAAFTRSEEIINRNAIAYGKLGEAIHGMLNELAAEGVGTQAKIFETLKSGVDSLDESLAKFIVTGKGGFLQVIEQMEISLTRLVIQMLMAKAIKAIFGDQTGAAVAQTATSNVVRQAAIGQSAAEAATSAAWAGPEAAIAAAAITLGALEGITAVGMLESGGRAEAGKPYIVGERRPELFVPDVSGHVIPHVPSGFGDAVGAAGPAGAPGIGIGLGGAAGAGAPGAPGASGAGGVSASLAEGRASAEGAAHGPGEGRMGDQVFGFPKESRNAAAAAKTMGDLMDLVAPGEVAAATVLGLPAAAGLRKEARSVAATTGTMGEVMDLAAPGEFALPGTLTLSKEVNNAAAAARTMGDVMALVGPGPGGGTGSIGVGVGGAAGSPGAPGAPGGTSIPHAPLARRGGLTGDVGGPSSAAFGLPAEGRNAGAMAKTMGDLMELVAPGEPESGRSGVLGLSKEARSVAATTGTMGEVMDLAAPGEFALPGTLTLSKEVNNAAAAARTMGDVMALVGPGPGGGAGSIGVGVGGAAGSPAAAGAPGAPGAPGGTSIPHAPLARRGGLTGDVGGPSSAAFGLPTEGRNAGAIARTMGELMDLVSPGEPEKGSAGALGLVKEARNAKAHGETMAEMMDLAAPGEVAIPAKLGLTKEVRNAAAMAQTMGDLMDLITGPPGEGGPLRQSDSAASAGGEAGAPATALGGRPGAPGAPGGAASALFGGFSEAAAAAKEVSNVTSTMGEALAGAGGEGGAAGPAGLPGGLKFMEMGGSVTPGQSYIVGEKRAEVFSPTTSGTIRPSLPAAAGGPSGGITIHYAPQITAVDSEGVDRVLEEHVGVFAKHIDKYIRSTNVGHL